MLEVLENAMSMSVRILTNRDPLAIVASITAEPLSSGSGVYFLYVVSVDSYRVRHTAHGPAGTQSDPL
jgi:hypothetical protein